MTNELDKFKVGDKAEISHKVTLADIGRFVEMTGDNNPLHTDAEFASTTSLKKPVVHGMLSASFISTIIGTKLPGPGALWYSQKLDFLLPVRIGDSLLVRATVQKIDVRQGIIELRTEVINQHKKRVIDGLAGVRLMKSGIKSAKGRVKEEVRTALIIGASGGIGEAVVGELSAAGYQLGIHYHSSKEKAGTLIRKHKSEKRSVILNGDVRDMAAMKDVSSELFNRFGRIDALVNCSTGYVNNLGFDELDWKDVEEHIDVHVKGAFNILKSVVPYMEKNKYGKVVHILTQAIEYPFTNLTPYITAKSALMGLSKSAALDLSRKGIRVNMVSPGITDTDLNADLPEKVKLVTEARTPLGRLATAGDVARAVAYLVSPASDFLTGETIRVNGGQIMI